MPTATGGAQLSGIKYVNGIHGMNDVQETRRKTEFFWCEFLPAVTGGLRSRGFFDDDGNALPVMEVFDKYRRGQPEE